MFASLVMQRSLGLGAVVLFISVLFACARGGATSRPMAADPALAPEDVFFIALGPDSHSSNANAFRVYAFAPDHAVIADSVRFCLASQDDCLIGRGRVVMARAMSVEGQTVFESKTRISLTDKLRLTVLGKNADGQEFVTGVTLVEKRGTARSKKPATTSSTATTTSNSADQQVQTAATTVGTATATDAQVANRQPDQNVPTQDGCYKAPDTFTCQVELEITRLTNDKRRSAGLSALAYDPKIAYVARLWSEEQAARNIISHEWIQTGVWQQRYMTEFNERPPVNSENVAQGMTFNNPTQTAQAFVELWWNSPQHRANILQTNITVVGVGFAYGYGGQSFGTQNFGFR